MLESNAEHSLWNGQACVSVLGQQLGVLGNRSTWWRNAELHIENSITHYPAADPARCVLLKDDVVHAGTNILRQPWGNDE